MYMRFNNVTVKFKRDREVENDLILKWLDQSIFQFCNDGVINGFAMGLMIHIVWKYINSRALNDIFIIVLHIYISCYAKSLIDFKNEMPFQSACGTS